MKIARTLPKEMKTLSEVMQMLAQQGIENEFVFTNDNAMEAFGKTYRPEDLHLVRTFRFEGQSDPADNVALYLLATTEEQLGYIIDMYGYDSNYGQEFAEFLKQIPVAEENE